MRRVRYSRLFLVGLILAGVVSSLYVAPAAEAARPPFNAGRIIDDGVFTNQYTMSVGQIQAFLNAKVPVCDTNHAAGSGAQGAVPPWRCLKDYHENPDTGANNLNNQPVPAGGISAAQIIWNYSQQFGINPQVLIVTLQKENGLITDTWPYPWQFRTAMGFACPDSAACNPAYYGFAKQVYQAARHFRNFYDNNPNWTVPYTPGVRYIKYNPDASCGGSNVNILNRATAALYSYTPYQPNAGAIAANYGTAPCGAYGNRNFFNYFTDWFGSTYGVGVSPAQCTTQLNVYRFWSKHFNNAHFFTANEGERNALLNDPKWQYEGVGFCASAGSSAGYYPVYRYWSPRFGNTHFFTASEAERAALARDRNWIYEGVAWYSPLAQDTDATAVTVARYWSPRFNNDHFFTGSTGEKNALSRDRNWIYEGVGWFAQLPVLP
jgi:hypothetical protein